jgi:hypothetical protein
MANLGECMLFYLKYAAEMDRLSNVEDPKDTKLEGLPDPDRVLKQIKLVGDTANRQVAELLERCAPGIEEHFHVISDVRRMRNNLEKIWDLRFKVGPKNATEMRFEIGVGIEPSQAALIPWVWCRGSRRAEDEVIRILGVGNRSDTLPGWASGTVVLDEIKIPIPKLLEEPVECDSLVTKVQQAFALITSVEVDALAGIASNRGEA